MKNKPRIALAIFEVIIVMRPGEMDSPRESIEESQFDDPSSLRTATGFATDTKVLQPFSLLKFQSVPLSSYQLRALR
jgi:hypothetical protein